MEIPSPEHMIELRVCVETVCNNQRNVVRQAWADIGLDGFKKRFCFLNRKLQPRIRARVAGVRPGRDGNLAVTGEELLLGCWNVWHVGIPLRCVDALYTNNTNEVAGSAYNPNR